MNITVDGRPALTVREASRRYGYVAHYMRQMIGMGKIESVKIEKVHLVFTDSLERYIASRDNRGDRGSACIPAAVNGG